MMSEKFERAFEESEEEPSVLSLDPNERKLARCLRIQKRIEALRRPDGEEEEGALEESPTERQIVASAELLEKLLGEGNEVITNVRIANDARELQRRKSASEARLALLERLDESARECERRHEAINERWAAILQSGDPLQIHEQMQWQRDRCDEVLAKKEAAIERLKLQLQDAEARYLEEQSQQRSDASLLMERIESQMGSMEGAHDRELELIEASLSAERAAVVGAFQQKWGGLYRQQEHEELAGEGRRAEIARQYEERMARAMREHDEECRARKVELENECQALQRQVERSKALCLLNAEKLSYNYAVLKSREEENSIVKSQQKRKINRLQAVINALQRNYCDLEQSTKVQINKLSNDIVKTHQSIRDLEEKSMHFARVNDKQYLDIWQMNDEKAGELVKKIFTADRLIHERILGILWESPARTLPKKEDLPSYRVAIDLAQNHKRQAARKSQDCLNRTLEKSLSEARLEKQVLNGIFKQISNSSGYLVESKLQELISHRSEEERTIVKLDNVFQALSISSPEEIDILLDFFLPYAHCPQCSANDGSSSTTTRSKSSTVFSETSSCSNICEGCNNVNVQALIASVKNDVNVVKATRQDAYDQDDILGGSSEKSEDCENIALNQSSKVARFKCNKGHVLEIQAACVTKALKEMMAKCNSEEEKHTLSFEEQLKESKYTISRNLSVTDVRKHWSNYRDTFTVQKEQLWDAVLIGLNKYYGVLKERHNLCNERDSLKKQNLELQRLLETQTTTPDDNLSILQVHSTKHLAYR